MSLKKIFHQYFSFTRSEQRGVLILSALLLILATARWLLPREPKLPEAIGKYQEPIDNFLRGQNSASSNKAPVDPKNPAKASPVLFSFDPNLITPDEGHRLGLSEQQMQNIINYRNKGGRFYRPEDLKKMYTLPESKYLELEPFISLNQEPRTPANGQAKNAPQAQKPGMPANRQAQNAPSGAWNQEPIELNEADSSALVRLRGIGPVLSARIVRYRKLLGGYVRVEQLKEVYGLRGGLVDTLALRLWADSVNIRKINLNSATERELGFHPYIGAHSAKSIVAYRDSKGKISQPRELLREAILTKEQFKKISPYLNTE